MPPVPSLQVDGTLGERARLTANFRDQYYGLVPAVAEDGAGPPLVTSGLVDPGRCAWGRRDVTFAKRRFRRPTVDLDRLEPGDAPLGRRACWCPRCSWPTRPGSIEAVADPDGRWLPGVPLITARPIDGADAWALAAVLTSPVATAWAWHRAGGTGLSAHVLRLGPRWLADLPWPAGELEPAVAALRDGDVEACGRAVGAAYGVGAGRRWIDAGLVGRATPERRLSSRPWVTRARGGAAQDPLPDSRGCRAGVRPPA